MKNNKNLLIAGNSTKTLGSYRNKMLALAQSAHARSTEEKWTTTEFLKRKRKDQKAKADRKFNRHQSRSQW